MEDLDVIDMLPGPLFIPADWIGTGKTFTATLPQQVLAEKQRQLVIPEGYSAHFPSSTLPVTQFIDLELPLQSTEIITTSTTVWFSKETAHNDLNIRILLNRPIPSKEFLADLKSAFGQAWLDGAQSVIDWRYNDGRERFPLWVVAFWEKLADTVKWQSLWKRSHCWLRTEITKCKYQNTSNQISMAEHALASLGWDVALHYQRGAISSSVLSGLLSTAWLNDEHINMIMEELADMLTKIPALASQIIIAPLVFAGQINNTAKNKSYTKQNASLLYKYQQRIAVGIQRIYFPINVNGNHWVAGIVDIENRFVGYGMDHS
ncbi:hypothetical protein BJV77DRAFT_300257 [Russula vinacea]|nr:hypothetical protein BJV77DRAFT_300257 [Russula vinacea]